MKPGIDPKVDIAFKKLFGSPQWPQLTMALIDAVLQPPPEQRLVELELMNPFSELMHLDDKLSILDIRARDERGRLFNVEMQMVAEPFLVERFLYYWAQLYSQQLAAGQPHDQLCPTISICFVNERLFPGRRRYHRQFHLKDDEDQQLFTDHQSIHVLELPNFRRELAQLSEPLDFWLYFFKNGVELDVDALPDPLGIGAIHDAMEVLRVFSQDELARELYQDRLKAQRDKVTSEHLRREAKDALRAAQDELASTKKRLDEARRDSNLAALAARIQLCQRLLGRPESDSADLAISNLPDLQALAEQLEEELQPGG